MSLRHPVRTETNGLTLRPQDKLTIIKCLKEMGVVAAGLVIALYKKLLNKKKTDSSEYLRTS